MFNKIIFVYIHKEQNYPC